MSTSHPAVHTIRVPSMQEALNAMDPFQAAVPTPGFVRWLSSKQPQQTARFEVWCDDMEAEASERALQGHCAAAVLEVNRANWNASLAE